MGRATPDLPGSVLIEGVGHEDSVEIQRLFERYLALDFSDELFLPRGYSGDVTFEIKARFTRGTLRTVDHSLSTRRHMDYGER